MARRTPLARMCLCTIAADQKGIDLFFTETTELTELPLSDAFIILLTICQSNTARDIVALIPGMPSFSAKIAQEGTDEELDAILALVRRIKTDAMFIQALDAERFLKQYLKKC
jgi:hypothetical protein